MVLYPKNTSMKAYIATTGTIFGLITGVHIWRAIGESPHLATEPWFILLTAVAAALCLWALRLLRHWPKP